MESMERRRDSLGPCYCYCRLFRRDRKFSMKVKLWFIIEESFCEKEDTIYIYCLANRKLPPSKADPKWTSGLSYTLPYQANLAFHSLTLICLTLRTPYQLEPRKEPQSETFLIISSYMEAPITAMQHGGAFSNFCQRLTFFCLVYEKRPK